MNNPWHGLPKGTGIQPPSRIYNVYSLIFFMYFHREREIKDMGRVRATHAWNRIYTKLKSGITLAEKLPI